MSMAVKVLELDKTEVLGHEVQTISKSFLDQVDIEWRPTRAMFDEGNVIGRIPGRAIKHRLSAENKDFLLVWVGNFKLVRVHFRQVREREQYQQIYVDQRS